MSAKPIRKIYLKGREPAVPEPYEPRPEDWQPVPPPCSRCGQPHTGEHYTWHQDDWVGDPCLTPEERRLWVREKSRPA